MPKARWPLGTNGVDPTLVRLSLQCAHTMPSSAEQRDSWICSTPLVFPLCGFYRKPFFDGETFLRRLVFQHMCRIYVEPMSNLCQIQVGCGSATWCRYYLISGWAPTSRRVWSQCWAVNSMTWPWLGSDRAHLWPEHFPYMATIHQCNDPPLANPHTQQTRTNRWSTCSSIVAYVTLTYFSHQLGMSPQLIWVE